MHTNNLVKIILENEYPDIYVKVNERLSEFRAKEFTEENVMQAYFDFAKCTNIDITEVHWLKETGLRRDMVAFMLLTFAPEKIRGYTNKMLTWGLAKEISLIVQVSSYLISKDVSIVCDEFRIYKEFKNKCLELFDKNI